MPQARLIATGVLSFSLGATSCLQSQETPQTEVTPPSASEAAAVKDEGAASTQGLATRASDAIETSAHEELLFTPNEPNACSAHTYPQQGEAPDHLGVSMSSPRGPRRYVRTGAPRATR